MFMMGTECHFVPQRFSVVDEFRITFTGTDDDQQNCILAIELIQNIKPDEGENLNPTKPWDALVYLQVEVNVSCIAL
jgi:hypothetical protein